jgi:methylated-DNA-[protein]-cysteine S-methyltransferase
VTPIHTRLGTFQATFTPAGLRQLAFPSPLGGEGTVGVVESTQAELAAVLERQLTAYLDGRLTTFSLPLDLVGTPFQRSVWGRVLDIPYGGRATYGAVARALGRPRAARAVGAANGANPVPIVVPCHRLVGASGDLTGYGGGLELKRRLLRLEQTAPGAR